MKFAIVSDVQMNNGDLRCALQQELVGGEILTLLDEKRSSNVDPHLVGLLDRLLEKAMVPYLLSLDAWVFHGQVDDVSLDVTFCL